MGQAPLRPAAARRRLLAGGAAALGAPLLAGLVGCSPAKPAEVPTRWVGTDALRGHRLRDAWPDAAAAAGAVQRRAAVLVCGAGIAGLAAARALQRQGVDDLRVLELEDAPGGNSRAHALGGIACPLGAHYLPLPPPEAVEVDEWLHEIGLLRSVHGRRVADERHLAHAPQERLWFGGEWVEGLLPPAPPGSAALAQRRRFGARIAALARDAQGGRAFALPVHRAPWTETQAALDAQSFAAWLDAEGFTEPGLRAYLDYCCRDDYGAGAAQVSAWAGVHYFASRHGFGAGGSDGDDEVAGHGGVFTWPEGNGWLVRRLAEPLGERLLPGRVVQRVEAQREGVAVLAWDAAAQRLEAWRAGSVVLALPLFVAARVLAQPPPALTDALAMSAPRAPWLVAQLLLREPLLDRVGAPPAWDNVLHGARGLGYVDAMHQSLGQRPGATVLSVYHALPHSERAALLQGDAAAWRERVLAELDAPHPDLRAKLAAVDLARHGHAMAVPAPGTMSARARAARAALRGAGPLGGRIRFAHADLAGYSVFEEAFAAGHEAGAAPPRV